MTSLARLIVISSKLMNIPLAAAWTVVLSFFSCSSSWRYDRGVDIDAQLRHAQLLESFRSDNRQRRRVRVLAMRALVLSFRPCFLLTWCVTLDYKHRRDSRFYTFTELFKDVYYMTGLTL